MHTPQFEEILRKAAEKAPEGVDKELWGHKAALMLTKNRASGCMTCEHVWRQYSRPDIYFEVAKQAVVTGVLRDSALAIADHRKFKSEFPALKQFGGELLQAE